MGGIPEDRLFPQTEDERPPRGSYKRAVEDVIYALEPIAGATTIQVVADALAEAAKHFAINPALIRERAGASEL